MRGKKAKQLRKAIYGKDSGRAEHDIREYRRIDKTGQIVDTGARTNYQGLKTAYRNFSHIKTMFDYSNPARLTA